MKRSTTLLVTASVVAALGIAGATGNLNWIPNGARSIAHAWMVEERQQDAAQQQAHEDAICNSLESSHVMGQEEQERQTARNYGCDYPAEPTSPPTVEQADAALTAVQSYAQANDLHQSIRMRIAQGTEQNPANVGSDVHRLLFLYLRALPAGPFVQTDLDRLVNELDADDHHHNLAAMGFSLTAQSNYITEAWENGTVPEAVLRPILTRIFHNLIADARSQGYNPAHRYTAHELNTLACSGPSVDVSYIARISMMLAADSAETMTWRFARAEQYRLGGCEVSGEVDWGGMREAYDDYVASGHAAYGAGYAQELADHYLSLYANGDSRYVQEEAGGNLVRASEPAGEEEQLVEARIWLGRLPAAARIALLRSRALRAEQDHNLEIAKTLYQEAGDSRNVVRLTALIAGQPRQDG